MDSSKVAREVFDGVMLSDGSLRRDNGRFRVTQSGWEHLDWLYSIRSSLAALSIRSKTFSAIYSSKGKAFEYCHLDAGTSPFLVCQYRRWYPDGVKEVPEDFCFTPASLANEFMGDGSSTWSNGNPDNGVYVTLATRGFSLTSVERLERCLEKVGLVHLSRAYYQDKKGAGVSIRVLGGSTRAFMSAVEPFIVPSYRYKVKWPGQGARLGTKP